MWITVLSFKNISVRSKLSTGLDGLYPFIFVTTYPPPFDGLVEESDHILSLNPLTFEAFRPLCQDGVVQTNLFTGEGEGESQGNLLIQEIIVAHELVDTFCDVVKQLK